MGGGGSFHVRLAEISLGSFGAVCKISDLQTERALSTPPRSFHPAPTRFYGHYSIHWDMHYHFLLANCQILKKICAVLPEFEVTRCISVKADLLETAVRRTKWVKKIRLLYFSLICQVVNENVKAAGPLVYADTISACIA